MWCHNKVETSSLSCSLSHSYNEACRKVLNSHQIDQSILCSEGETVSSWVSVSVFIDRSWWSTWLISRRSVRMSASCLLALHACCLLSSLLLRSWPCPFCCCRNVNVWGQGSPGGWAACFSKYLWGGGVPPGRVCSGGRDPAVPGAACWLQSGCQRYTCQSAWWRNRMLYMILFKLLLLLLRQPLGADSYCGHYYWLLVFFCQISEKDSNLKTCSFYAEQLPLTL